MLMAISSRLKDFLDAQSVDYEVLEHPEAFTAQETAGAQHVSGANVIKPVVVRCDGQPVMCVLPAIHMIDLDKFQDVSGATKIVLATEAELGDLFPDYPLGAEPPFGRLYGLTVFIDTFFEDIEDVCFNAGTHTEMVRMKFKDYLDLAKPVTMGDFGKHV